MVTFTIIWAFLTLMVPVWMKKKGVSEAQSIATTFGILGTFLGIIYGLINFDVNNIDAAVLQLLDGLRFAFVTSIVGMAVALFIGIFPKKFGFELSETGANKSESELLSEMLIELKTLNANISGDTDTTLITQIQKLRTSIVDKQDELKKAFDEFARQMAENNMKALIDAVDKVMKDFNTKINDQLGENFKRLSEGVEGLIVWQDQYRQQITDGTKALQESNKTLGVSVESLGVFVERSQEFERIAKELKEIIETMGSTMTGLKGLAETLEGSGKQIRDEMEEITKRSIESLGQHLAGVSEKMVEDYSQLQRVMSAIVNK